jgi:hypothetical protein
MPENVPLLLRHDGTYRIKTYIILNARSFLFHIGPLFLWICPEKKETDTIQDWTIEPSE